MTRDPKIRELRVIDIRCRAEGCGAGPGEQCRWAIAVFHTARYKEHRSLVDNGWQWQEIDTRDDGASR